jgi:hypothetical protein
VKPKKPIEMLAYIHAHRTSKTPFDAVIIGAGHVLGKGAASPRKSLKQLEQAGATWGLQSVYLERNSLETMRAVIRQGPPKSS